MPPDQGGERLPPQSREAERCVLGSMLRDNGVIGDVVQEAYDRIDTRHQSDQTSISGLPTGFIDLDEKTAGLQNSELVIIAARPSAGKTAFSINIVRNIAVEEK